MVVRLLGVAGAGILLIGVALLLAFAIQNGYLGPGARVGGAAALAVALVAAAHKVHGEPKRAAGAVAIAAAGYATAYLDVIAATVIYHWLTPEIGLALGALIAASGIVLARAWNRQFLAIVTVGGVAALAPAVGDGATQLTAGFLVVLAIAAWPAHLGTRWLALHVTRVVPAAIALIAAAEEPGFAVVALAGTLAAFELGTAVIAARIGLQQRAPMLLTPLLVVSALPLFAVADLSTPQDWHVLLPAAAAYLLAAVVAGGGADLPWHARVAPWSGGIATAFALATVADLTSGAWRALAVTALALAYAALARTAGQRAPGWQRGAAIALVLIAGLTVLPTLGLLVDQVSAVARVELAGTLSLLVAALAVALITPVAAALADRAAVRMADLSARDPQAAPGPVPAHAGPLHAHAGPPQAHAHPGQAAGAAYPGAAAGRRFPAAKLVNYLGWAGTLILACGAVVAAAVVVGRAADAPAGGFIAGHGLATLLIAIGAAYLLMHGLRRSADSSLALRAGLVLAAVAVGKLLFFDLATLDGIVRIGAFIGAGLALLAMGTGYARALDRSRPA